MPNDASALLTISTVLLCAALLWVPGGLAAAAAGLRGWTLAAVAPVLTYAIAGLLGPWMWKVGIPFNPVTFAIGTVVFVGLFALARRFSPGAEPADRWPLRAHLAVGATLLAATAFGAAVLMTAMGDLNAIPQDWDAGYHANGIRYIAETGEGSLYATGRVNWYEVPQGVFYPNAYHLVGAVVFKLGAAPIPAVLNANTALLPGMLALSLVVLVKHFRRRAVTAGYTAIAAVTATSATYDNLWRGPLLPFTVGLALTPVLAVVLDRYLSRPGFDTGAVFGGCAVGLLALHSSTLFNGILFVLPLLAHRWWRAWPRMRRELVLLLIPAGAAALLCAPHLLGALTIGGQIQLMDWPSTFPVSQSVGTLITFQHVIPHPQYWLSVALIIGLATLSHLAGLRWIAWTAALFGVFWVLTASFPQPWVAKATSPWWNDQFRLIALACVPLVVVAGNGLTWVHDHLDRLLRRRVPVLSSIIVLLAFALLTHGLYFRTNVNQAYRAYGYTAREDQSFVVTRDEVRAMQKLGELVRPGERVMNDRMDGTLWMYAIAGVQPVAGHYDGSLEAPSIGLLQARFRDYDRDPAVRDAVRHLNVRYALVGRGWVRQWVDRMPGVRDLDRESFLEKVYENADATVYRLR